MFLLSNICFGSDQTVGFTVTLPVCVCVCFHRALLNVVKQQECTTDPDIYVGCVTCVAFLHLLLLKQFFFYKDVDVMSTELLIIIYLS